MLPTPSKSPWFEQGSSFISLEDIMVGVQFTPRQRAFTVLRFAETHSAVLGLSDLCLQRFWLVPSLRYFLKLFLIVTGVGGALPNLLLNSCWTWTALGVSANLRIIKALWRGVNCTPTMMSSTLINEDPCSNHGLLDGVGNTTTTTTTNNNNNNNKLHTINNVYSLKHMNHDKDEFNMYNCSQHIDNVNNTHLLGCCLSWSRIVNTELGKSVE